LHLSNNRVQVYHFEFKKLFAAEGEQLPSERSGALGCLLNRRYLRVERTIAPGVLEENFGVSADHHQKIVEIVGHTASKPSYGFHSLGLAELIFPASAVRLRPQRLLPALAQ